MAFYVSRTLRACNVAYYLFGNAISVIKSTYASMMLSGNFRSGCSDLTRNVICSEHPNPIGYGFCCHKLTGYYDLIVDQMLYSWTSSLVSLKCLFVSAHTNTHSKWKKLSIYSNEPAKLFLITESYFVLNCICKYFVLFHCWNHLHLSVCLSRKQIEMMFARVHTWIINFQIVWYKLNGKKSITNISTWTLNVVLFSRDGRDNDTRLRHWFWYFYPFTMTVVCSAQLSNTLSLSC